MKILNKTLVSNETKEDPNTERIGWILDLKAKVQNHRDYWFIDIPNNIQVAINLFLLVHPYDIINVRDIDANIYYIDGIYNNGVATRGSFSSFLELEENCVAVNYDNAPPQVFHLMDADILED